MSLRTKSGFTILEVLIVLAVFGLFIALGALSLNNSRARMRDAQRLSNIASMRVALSRFWLEKATYPASTGINLGKAGANADVLTASGFVAVDAVKDSVYLERISAGPDANEYYFYHGGPNGYAIRFQTEKDTELGKANVYFAHSSGIDQEDTEK